MNPKSEEALLSLYNALNNSNYTDASQLTIHKLGNYIFLGKYNDVSFCINFTMNLYEHQSTLNKNMPLRSLLYVTDLYKTYIKENKFDIYRDKLIPLPKPKFVVFYIGENKQKEVACTMSTA